MHDVKQLRISQPTREISSYYIQIFSEFSTKSNQILSESNHLHFFFSISDHVISAKYVTSTHTRKNNNNKIKKINYIYKHFVIGNGRIAFVGLV